MKHSSFVTIILITAITGCNDPFSYSPFEVSVEERLKNTTAKNLRRILQTDTAESPSFKVAFLSDSHYHFEKLAMAVDNINSRPDISFVFVVGDITENGLQKEFELFHSIMKKCRVPYLTVIGNHDYLSNGGEVYQQIFGSLNYSFTYHSVKFIIWDNVFWESQKTPDFNWLENQLRDRPFESSSADSGPDYIIPVAHIPPSDQQFKSSKERYHKLLLDHDVRLSVHGHKHRYSLSKLFDDDIEFLTVGSPQYREYSILNFNHRIITIDRVNY